MAASQPSPSDGFGVGELIEVQDKAKTGWYSAKVLEQSETGVKIHYMGWATRFDEVIRLDSGRLASGATAPASVGSGRGARGGRSRWGMAPRPVSGMP